MMKFKHILVLPLLPICFMACSSDTLSIQPSTMSNQPNTPLNHVFYMTADDIVDLPKALSEHRLSAELIVYNGCLSVKPVNSDEILTLVIPDKRQILLDKEQNIIGFVHHQSNKKYVIGDKIGLNGSTVMNAQSSKKAIPKNCSRQLMITGEII